MDEWIGLIIFLAIIFGLGKIIAAVTSTAKGAITTIKEGGDFLDNVKTEYRGMGMLEARAIPIKYSLGNRDVDAFDIEIRGLLGARYQTDALLVTSLFDATDGKLDPTVSGLDFMQEASTEAYQKISELGSLGVDQGFKRWTKAAVVFPETITGSFSGERRLKALVRVIPKVDLDKIYLGLHDEDTTIFSSAFAEFTACLDSKGYVEAAAEYDNATVFSVEIAVAVATLDGPLKPNEALVIQEWIRHHVNNVRGGDRHEALKEKLNSAFKRAFERANANNLNLDAIIDDLGLLNLRSSNQLLLELLVKVISADNEVTPDEMQLIKNIGNRLGVDVNEIKAMADKAFLDMNLSADDDALEGILGIEPGWTKEQILAHLRKEFAKWNGRIQALEDEQEKEKAQQMLDAIATVRKKYN